MDKVNIACVIDDDPIYTYTVKRIIDRSLIADKTLFFSDGKQAFDFFKENSAQTDRLPDLILLDINMPVWDGWQFMDEFVKISNTIKKKITVYVVSSSIDEDDHRKACSYKQIADFVIKPISDEVLKKMVEYISA
ncbi:response regulator [Mucilaginibacter sp. SP1R1]|uniref:response regulator n=1 Tax=Mucilaginibacter sp. SP1R1 TaxID=2723091 RepID=UPI0016191922|nr:response regulator [Mucilaginibacter sp. SP1R1]MBB6150295.1 CheY-like chemotaxis protein [Mucilaginibacter sp. SP1R1]